MNSDTPSANIVGFGFATDVDTTIKAVCRTVSPWQTVVDTGAGPSTSNPQLFEIVPTSGGERVTFYNDGTLAATISTNVPATTVARVAFCVWTPTTMAPRPTNSTSTISTCYCILTGVVGIPPRTKRGF
jgi:hypothetical protein